MNLNPKCSEYCTGNGVFRFNVSSMLAMHDLLNVKNVVMNKPYKVQMRNTVLHIKQMYILQEVIL